MTKRILISVLCLLLAISLCACGGNNNGKKSDNLEFEQAKELEKTTDSFKDVKKVSATNKVVQSSLKNPANAGDWIEVETRLYDDSFDPEIGTAKVRISEIYSLEDSRSLLNKLYQNEDKINKEMFNRMTKEEQAEFENALDNSWQEIYDSKYPVQAIELTVKFDGFKKSKYYLDYADFFAYVVDTYGEEFEIENHPIVYFSNYVVDNTELTSINGEFKAYALFNIPDNLNEDYMLEFNKYVEDYNKANEYIIIDANKDNNAESSKNVKDNAESFASKAKSSTLKNPLKINEAGSYDTYKGKMYAKLEFVSTDVDEKNKERTDTFKILVDTKEAESDDKRVVYSCSDCGVDGYYEEAVFVYLYNKANGKALNYLDDVKKDTTVTSKEQFRTMELAFEK